MDQSKPEGETEKVESKKDKKRKERKEIKKRIKKKKKVVEIDPKSLKPQNCPLCDEKDTIFKVQNVSRPILECKSCSLLFVHPDYFISEEQEKERYSFHQNVRDEGYVKFLHKVIDPCLKFIEKNQNGLNYGCGSNDVLSEELIELGYQCESFDPFFKKQELKKEYDFIFSTEVFEHFKDTKKEIEKVLSILKVDGVLALTTYQWDSTLDLKNWWYLRDSTHVCAYHKETFQFLAKKYNLEILYTDDKSVMILKKLKE